MLMTNPSTKGSKHLAEALNPPKFNARDLKNLDNLSLTHKLDHTTLQTQITKLTTTSKALEGKDLQFSVLRNTCITNNKLLKWKILDTPKCTLCNNPTQDSAHRFYFCLRQSLSGKHCQTSQKNPHAHTLSPTPLHY